MLCKYECGLPERHRYCPVRLAPTQIFDLGFDLSFRSATLSFCNHTNVSGAHWFESGYQTYVSEIDSLEDVAEETNDTVAISLERPFLYYGRPVYTVYASPSGLVTFGAPPATGMFLRKMYWPHLAVCALCSSAKLGTGSRLFYELKGAPDDERLVLSFAPSDTEQTKDPSYQASFSIATGSIVLRWLDITIENATAVVGLSHGQTPEWKALAYDSLDFSDAANCVFNATCPVETGVRPIGRTRPPETRPYPWAVAPPFNPHPQFCEYGCANYYTNWTLAGCKDACDAYYDYDITTGYSDRAEVARFECYDGCAIGNLRCQPGFFCDKGVMAMCPPGKYRDFDYHHVTRCVSRSPVDSQCFFRTSAPTAATARRRADATSTAATSAILLMLCPPCVTHSLAGARSGVTTGTAGPTPKATA